MAGLVIKPRARIFHGHEWIYASDVQKTFGTPEAGSVITLKDFKDRPMGVAIYNPQSQIVARRFSRRKQDLDLEFFRRRLQRAIDYRKSLPSWETKLQRLVWSESDGLPGVIIDRYGDHLVLQTLTLAMDFRKNLIVEALVELLAPKSIIEGNDAPIRKAEGMTETTGTLHGTSPEPFRVETAWGAFCIDLLGGQKTGLYLDQLDNYAAIGQMAKGRRVLDAFCNQGGFALAAAKGQAASVTAVDSSAPAIEMAKGNAAHLGVTVEWVEANVFDFLKAAEREAAISDENAAPSKARWDHIVLDPPSFARSKGSVRDALRGYKELHLRALKILPTGGRLSTFSCSHHVSTQEFMETIIDAAVDAKKTIRLVMNHGQSADHPVLPALPETEYLKGFTVELLGAW